MLIHRGYFNTYRISDSRVLNESHERTLSFDVNAIHSGNGVPVFISHKHSDLNELEGLLEMLVKHYNVIPYIDSMDKGMPKNTCAATAIRVKQAINYCQKFILLATEDALTSKWCNWEVGIADKWKLDSRNMAIFPLLDRETEEDKYKGSEYLEIYPYIEEVTDYFTNKRKLVVKYMTAFGSKQISLEEWLNRRIIL